MRTIFNTSFIIEDHLEKEWVEFMKEEYVLPIQGQRTCKDILFTKVSIDQESGKTYSLQLVFNSPEDQETFLRDILPHLEEKLIRKYDKHYLCFSSVLTEV